MSTPSSSSSSSIYPWKYGIFLSFSGEDTRKTFTDHLYGALNRFGINSFRDVDNLERGEDIAPGLLQAIGESWGSILVFSKRYVYSTWCLDELAEIVKQRKERGHKVFPIFHHVEPSHLRKQSESVQEAFAQHEERFKENKEKIQRWRDALSEVASISGWPLDDQYELNFIEDIAKEIFSKLFETCSHWKKMNSKLSIGQDEDVRVIGICGTSGIGKTALARVVYTQMSLYFEAKSFLADVGEVSINNGLVSLQKQLLSQILPEEIFIFSSIQEGSDIICRKLCQKKVLIVMDDVDNISQLKCIVGKREGFGLGSKIIITTKEEQLLQSFGVDDVCKLTTSDAASTVLVSKDILINVDQNFNTLKRKLENLNAVKEDNESKKIIELQPRKKLKKEVEIWFRNVERLNAEILDDLETEVRRSNIFSCGFVGANVLNRIPEVEELLQQGRSFTGLVIDDPHWVGQVLSTTNLVGEDAKRVLEEIWVYLMGVGISKIGVWGMGGSGKTTTVKLINNQLLKEKKFQSVIWVTVSKETNIAKLQNDIACAMKEESLFSEDDETIRAGKLYEKLVEKGRYVLILDDLWEELSLEKVGIPETSNGSKLLVTTRSLEVCRFLDCQEIKMPTLSKLDAWNLFLQKVGRDVLNCPNPELLPIVRSVAEECDGLPLAIVTIASSMKGVLSICVWRNALRELRSHVDSVDGMKEKVFQQLQFSYDRLQNEQLKHCFLYCALYPEDWKIYANGLIELWIVEGVVEEMDSRQAKIDKGHTILNKLKNSCLLVDFDNESVQMHDLMRDMALRNTEVRHRFLVRAGMQLSDIPDLHKWNEDLEKVSLMGNRGLEIPSQISPPKCPKLTTLLLSYCNIKSIPECFFEQMHGLKILDLSNNPIESLPESIFSLETLTTLLLRHCRSLEKVPSLSKLEALKKLDLKNTTIKDLPHGMERLVNLEYLDLSDTCITEIAGRIVTKYTSLQHLAVIDLQRVGIFMSGEEIGRLKKLEFFGGRFYDLNEWKSYMQLALQPPIGSPCQYHIYVGHEGPYFNSRELKFIEFNGCDIFCTTDGFKVLSDVKRLNIIKCIVDLCKEETFFSRLNLMPDDIFSSLSRICIVACKNIKKLFSSNWVLQKNLQNLDELYVCGCEDMEEIIASESGLEEEGISAIKLSLPKLKTFQLKNLPKLKSICSEVLVCDSIQVIDIKKCPNLKRIPLSLPLHNDGQPYPPPFLEKIVIRPKKRWKLVEWAQPNAKSLLEPYVK